MALVSRRQQVAHVDGIGVRFGAGERVRTEFSYKYEPEEFAAFADQAGLAVIDVWMDPRRMFSVQYLALRQSARR
jgi:uncharacterized SAM-dependent methyltransferase